MVQLTCTMIQLANVSRTVRGPLATAGALVVLATIQLGVCGKMKGCARVIVDRDCGSTFYPPTHHGTKSINQVVSY